MNMICHQAPRVNLTSTFAGLLGKNLQIKLEVLLRKKADRPIVPSLNEM
jgi:hypothetical protein